jgi:hypothetical protein
MDNYNCNRPQPAIALRPLDRIGSAAARGGRALGVALAMLGAGTVFIPLGDNRQLLAELAARVRATRPCTPNSAPQMYGLGKRS